MSNIFDEAIQDLNDKVSELETAAERIEQEVTREARDIKESIAALEESTAEAISEALEEAGIEDYSLSHGTDETANEMVREALYE